jgi:hypothetical protein
MNLTVFISLKGRERADGRISLQGVKITIEDLDTLLRGIKTMTIEIKMYENTYFKKTHLLSRKID